MKNINLSESQSMQVLRDANPVPLQFQPAACAITQSVTGTNWRAYGWLNPAVNCRSVRSPLWCMPPSVWVPFTSESKEAIASYPEIVKELRLGLQAVGRKLAVYFNRRKRVRQEGKRREIFLRYFGGVAHAAATIKDYSDRPRQDLYGRLVDVAKRKTAVADAQLNDERNSVKTRPRN